VLDRQLGTGPDARDDVPQLVSILVEGLAECIPPSVSVPRPGPKQEVVAPAELPTAQLRVEPSTDPGPGTGQPGWPVR
jgi:hypothetical protein